MSSSLNVLINFVNVIIIYGHFWIILLFLSLDLLYWLFWGLNIIWYWYLLILINNFVLVIIYNIYIEIYIGVLWRNLINTRLVHSKRDLVVPVHLSPHIALCYLLNRYSNIRIYFLQLIKGTQEITFAILLQAWLVPLRLKSVYWNSSLIHIHLLQCIISQFTPWE